MLPLYITFKKRHKKRKFFSGFSEATRRLPGTPAESEAPEAQINRQVENPIY